MEDGCTAGSLLRFVLWVALRISPSLRSQSTTGLGREVIGLQKAKATAAASKAGQRTHHWSMRVGGMTMRVPPCGILFSMEAAPGVGCFERGRAAG